MDARAEASTPCGPVDGTLPDREAEQLFTSSSVPVFDFYLPAEQWTSLKARARDEKYTSAQACFEGKAVGTVGLRFKGGVGTLQLCFDQQGRQTCPKLSMKVKFDEYESGLRFHGLKRLNFHSMIRDVTHLHERLSYDLYRKMGIKSPRSSWAVLRVNGEAQGLFSMVEQVDGRFTQDRWGDNGDGNLYKEAWPISRDAAYYAERLETNEEVATHEAFVGFAASLADAPAENRDAAISRFMDLPYLYTYMAVDSAVTNWDGITAFYVSPDRAWSGNHNYYVYQEETRPFFWLIPWDLDNTFVHSAPVAHVPVWTSRPADCARTYPVFNGFLHVLAPGCDNLLAALALRPESYRAALRLLLDGPFQVDALVREVDQYTALLHEAVEKDAFGHGLTAWLRAIEGLKSDLPLHRQRIEQLAAGVPITPFLLKPTGINDFENVDTLGVVTGASLATNPHSSASLSVNTTEPLAGAKHLSLQFQLRDESAGWQQWIYLSTSLSDAPADMTGRTGIRFRARADQARVLRFEVESPKHTAATLGIRFGWDVQVTSEPQLVEVRFANIAVPAWVTMQGVDPRDDVKAILASVTGLAMNPQPVGRDAAGFLPQGTDAGRLDIDDLEFF
jgi:hypothetical protein